MELEFIIDFEKKLLDPLVRKDVAIVNQLLDDSFIEFGTSGKIYNKKITIDMLQQEDSTPIEALDFEPVQLATDLIQLRFKTRRKLDDGSWSSSLRSSIWKNINGAWRMIFHQGTRTML
jgi:hypothetical protein